MRFIHEEYLLLLMLLVVTYVEVQKPTRLLSLVVESNDCLGSKLNFVTNTNNLIFRGDIYHAIRRVIFNS